MNKTEKLKNKYLKVKEEKRVVDIKFHKALNKYFCSVHGNAVGPAIAYASTLDW